MRRKYRFKTRLEAEDQYFKTDHERLMLGWLLTELRSGSNVMTAHIAGNEIGYVIKQHHAFVYWLTDDHNYCVRGVWDIDDPNIPLICESLRRYDESYDLGMALDYAHNQCKFYILKRA